jgi:hypothetical protein
MIAGDLRVVERDGTPLVVDRNGDTVVCRGSSQHVGGTSRYFHRIDTGHFATTGEIRAACGEVAHHHDQDWLPKRRADLDSLWAGCSYRACFGDYDPSDSGPKASGHDGLAATLEAMSVAEFDAAVADHQMLRIDRGER